MRPIRAAILTVSDTCSRGEREDISGRTLQEILEANGHEVADRAVVPDDAEAIANVLAGWCAKRLDVALTTGGTGFSPRDVTPEATRAVIERDAPGISELLRFTGYQKLDRAILSRGVSGIRGDTLIVNLPGSPSGVRDGMSVLIPLLPHAVALLHDEPVDHTPRACEPEMAENGGTPSTVTVIETNLDDLSPEVYESAVERLFTAGALDVYLSSIQMKKGRPGTLLSVIARPDDAERLAEIIFRETTAFGVRFTEWNRLILDRRWTTIATDYGAIRIKIGSRRGETTTASPEYADIKSAADAHNVPAKTVFEAALRVFYAETDDS